MKSISWIFKNAPRPVAHFPIFHNLCSYSIIYYRRYAQISGSIINSDNCHITGRKWGSKMKLVKYILVFLFCIVIASCSNLKSETHLSNLKFIQENYKKDDLLNIQSIGTEDEITCYWGISEEHLGRQKKQNLQDLLLGLDYNKLYKYAEVFINEGFSGRYNSKYIFISMEYEFVNKKRYGNKTDIKRDDWIIVFNYSLPDDDYLMIREKVFMLPDGTIIISSNNFEDINKELLTNAPN